MIVGKRVQVYYNFHKKCWSVRDKKTRRVIGWTQRIRLKDVVFKVSEAGRQRVLSQRRKNVHAWAEGTITQRTPAGDTTPVVYNPYKYSTFVENEQQRPVASAAYVCMDHGNVLAKGTCFGN